LTSQILLVQITQKNIVKKFVQFVKIRG